MLKKSLYNILKCAYYTDHHALILFLISFKFIFFYIYFVFKDFFDQCSGFLPVRTNQNQSCTIIVCSYSLTDTRQLQYVDCCVSVDMREYDIMPIEDNWYILTSITRTLERTRKLLLKQPIYCYSRGNEYNRIILEAIQIIPELSGAINKSLFLSRPIKFGHFT